MWVSQASRRSAVLGQAGDGYHAIYGLPVSTIGSDRLMWSGRVYFEMYLCYCSAQSVEMLRVVMSNEERVHAGDARCAEVQLQSCATDIVAVLVCVNDCC